MLQQIELLWREFVRATSGRCPTHLLCSPLEAFAIRDELNTEQMARYGYIYRARDGHLRIKGALVIEHPNIDKITFVWTPGEQNAL